MTGVHNLVIQSSHLKYEMSFSRNITVIQGDSATGKTTLIDMIREFLLNGSDTGISLSCDCPCRVVEGNTWQEQLASIKGSIVFIDEGNRFVSSTDFAGMIRESDNYYVLVTREALDNLPYSVTEIYGIRSSGKFGVMEPVYHHMYRIYSDTIETLRSETGLVIVEDSNSGYDFFSKIADEAGINCVSSDGSGGIFNTIVNGKNKNGECIVVADGAAFGAQMGRVYKLAEMLGNIRLYLPESFEWIILSSNILEDKEVRMIIENPSDYIDT